MTGQTYHKMALSGYRFSWAEGTLADWVMEGPPLGRDSGLRRPGQREYSPDHGRIRAARRAGDRAPIAEGWREAGLPLGHSFQVIWSARAGEFAWGLAEVKLTVLPLA